MTKSNCHNGSQTKFITLYVETEENGLERVVTVNPDNIVWTSSYIKEMRERDFTEEIIIGLTTGDGMCITFDGHIAPGTNEVISFQTEFEWAMEDKEIHIQVEDVEI